VPGTNSSAGIEVSVVVPAYNCASWLEAQLDALWNQEGAPPFEVVIVDDGSTDGSVAVAESYRDRFAALTVISQSHVGNVASSRNTGVRRSTGRKLLFCDADDVVGSTWVAGLAAALDVHHFVAGPMEFDRLNPVWVRSLIDARQTDGLQTGDPPFLPYAGGGTLGMRREAFEAVGGFDPTMPSLEDTELCFRAQLQGFDLVFVPGAVVHVRLRNSLRTLYRQGRSWGYGTAALHRRFLEHGMPLPSRTRHLGGWILALPRLLSSFDRVRLARWVFAQGWRAGRLRGNLRYRLLIF
jgi:glycosyltransferase involved in cell wall biosynthesis